MTPNPRQTKLLDEVRARGAVSVERLAERLGVTLQTVRRDVQRLAEAGLVARFHGGVSVPSKASTADAWRQRQNMRAEAKTRIAQAVVNAIPDGSSLMLGVGTTVEAVARELTVRRRLHVVTHSVHVANILSEHPDCRIHLAGGLVRTRDRGIEGELALDFMRQFKVDIGLISAVGLDGDGSVRDQDYRDQKMLHAVIEQSREAWLLVDVSKFHRPAMIEIGRIDQVDHVYTDAPPPPPFPELLARSGVGLTVAGDLATAERNAGTADSGNAAGDR